MSKVPRPDPFFWHETGSNLFHAANSSLQLLGEVDASTRVVGLPEARYLDRANPYREQARRRTAWMLVGMAVENWLKGLIVASGANVSDKEWKGHNLVELARAAELDLEKEDRDFLRSLSGAVRWAGRYPSPNQNSELDDFDEKSQTKDAYRRVARKILARHEELDQSFNSSDFDPLDS